MLEAKTIPLKIREGYPHFLQCYVAIVNIGPIYSLDDLCTLRFKDQRHIQSVGHEIQILNFHYLLLLSIMTCSI